MPEETSLWAQFTFSGNFRRRHRRPLGQAICIFAFGAHRQVFIYHFFVSGLSLFFRRRHLFRRSTASSFGSHRTRDSTSSSNEANKGISLISDRSLRDESPRTLQESDHTTDNVCLPLQRDSLKLMNDGQAGGTRAFEGA